MTLDLTKVTTTTRPSGLIVPGESRKIIGPKGGVLVPGQEGGPTLTTGGVITPYTGAAKGGVTVTEGGLLLPGGATKGGVITAAPVDAKLVAELEAKGGKTLAIA